MSHSAEKQTKRYIGFAPKKSRGGPFCNLEIFSKNCFIWYTLYHPVCVKLGMGCVIVEGDSLALFTTMKYSPTSVISGIRQLIELIKLVISSVLKKKSHYYSRFFLRKRRLMQDRKRMHYFMLISKVLKY